MRPVRTRKGITDIDITECSQLFGKANIIRLFFRVKPQILHNQNLTSLQRRHRRNTAGANHIRFNCNRLPKQFCHTICHGLNAKRRYDLALWPSKMRQNDDFGSRRNQCLKAGQYPPDACINADLSILNGHIHIKA